MTDWMKCSECIWSKDPGAPLTHCASLYSLDDKRWCDRFFATKDVYPEGLPKDTTKIICHHCKREKDPGKCWWCLN